MNKLNAEIIHLLRSLRTSTFLPICALSLVMAGCAGSSASLADGGLQQSAKGAKDAGAATAVLQEQEKPASLKAAAAPTVNPFVSERIIDEKSATHGGPASYWHTVSGYGANGDMTYTYVNGNSVCNWMEYHSGLGAGTYHLYAFVPRAYTTTRSAKYHIRNGGSDINVVTVNQYNDYDVWHDLGSYSFNAEPSIFLGDDTGEAYTGTSSPKVGYAEVKFVGDGDVTSPSTGFFQGNSLWGSKRMYPSACKMASYGCLVTSEAYIARQFGYATDPGAFCDWLSNNAGFTSDGSLSSNDKIRQYTGGRAYISRNGNWHTIPADMAAIKSQIDAGLPVVLQVHYKKSDSDAYNHFVVGLRYTMSNGAMSDITIMDPMQSDGQLISIKKYIYTNSLSRWIYSGKFFSKG